MAALPAYIAACHAIATDWVEEYSPTARNTTTRRAMIGAKQN